MNGVAEALLEELLAQSRAQTQILQQLARGFSGTTGSGSGGSGGGLTASFGAANIAVKALSAGFNLLSSIVSSVFKIFGTIVGTAFNLVSAFNKLGEQALKTGIGLADLFRSLEGALSNIPILGKVMGFFADLASNADLILNSYRNLSRSGATFGGSLLDVVRAAKTTNLTLDQLNRTLSENRQAFAILGAGNVQEGFNKFIATQNRLMGPDSEYRRQLLGLGITAEEAAGFIGTMTRSQGVMGRNREIDENKLARQTNDYILQLDTLTRLTGIQKDQLDATIKKAQEDQLFQTFLDTLTEDQRKVAEQMIASAAPFGEEAVREVQARLRGLDVPVTEFGRSIAALNNGAMLDGRNLRDVMYNATKNTDGFTVGLEFMANASRGLGETLSTIPKELIATGMFSKIPQSLIAFDRSIREKGIAATIEEITKKQKEASEGNAGAQADANLRVQQLGLAFAQVSLKLQGMFYPIMLSVFGGIEDFASEMTSLVDALTSSEGFKNTIKSVTEWFKNAFREVGAAFSQGGLKGGFSKIFEKIGEGFSIVWNEIKDPVIDAFEGLINWLKPYFGDLMDFIYDSLMNKLLPGGKEEREAVSRMNSARRQMEYINTLLPDTIKGSKEQLALSAKFAEQQAKYNEAKSAWDKMDKRNTEERVSTWSVAGGGAPVIIPEKRHSGTIGMTGNWWEETSGPLNVQAGETVLTQSQLSQIVDTAGSNKLAVQVERLNTLSVEMLVYLKETAQNTRDSVKATKKLNGNTLA